MVMHHSHGITLREYLQVNKKAYLPENEVKFIAYKLVKAISHLHNSDIVFRNLTLDSILVTEQGDIQLVNFQSSKILKNQALSGVPTNLENENLVTCSPEMLDGVSNYDFIVDWWALGILLYRMLISVPPFN